MKCLVLSLLLFQSFFMLNTSAQSNEVSVNASEEILVVGRRPGPPLWRLENGKNTLWVFALSPLLPKGFKWESSSVEHILSQSQEFIPLPRRGLGTSNPFKAIGFLRKFNKAKKLINDETLIDVLPPNDYERFKSLKVIYAIKSKKIEKLTPLFAAKKIYDRAIKTNNLIGSMEIERTVYKIAKRNKIKVNTIKVREKINTKQFITDIKSLSETEHLDCMSKTLDSLENQVRSVNEQALLWIEGDAQALINKSQSSSVIDGAPFTGWSCIEQLMKNDQIRRIDHQSRALWLNAAEDALKNNSSTFAVLNLADVIEPNGLVSLLANRGYKLIGPVRN